MEQWNEIRHRVLVKKESKRAILRETGMHWKTLEKILTHSQPPGYRQDRPRPKPKIGAFEQRIEAILKADHQLPKKQRHTAKRIWEVLQEEGYQGGYTAVKETVRRLRQLGQEVFMPLRHIPGEAQVDFGQALARVGGQLRKVHFFVMALPHSDGVFVMAFERECTETFWEGHVRAFEFFGGVPRRISYDNSRIAVTKIVGGGKDRKLTRGFLELQSHYLFEHHFCRVRRANEKGVVEGLVKYCRLNFLVPVPSVEDFSELNAHLEACCRRDLQRKLRGKPAAKEQLLVEDQALFLPLPAGSFEAARKISTRANSLSLVRFDSNDYSVPVCWAHHPVVAKGYCWEVVLIAQGKEVARHRRIWKKEQIRFEPWHYLALLERKPGALDYAQPLAGWQLAPCFTDLRHRLENAMGGEGTREYISVLRLLEKHPMSRLEAAVKRAMEHEAMTRDAIAQFLYGHQEWKPSTFTLEGHPHLRGVQVELPDLRQYSELVEALA